MKKIDLVIGDVVQLKPNHEFGGMLVVVTEPKEFGCHGYLLSPINFDACRINGLAFIRPRFEDFEYIGRVQWMVNAEESEDEKSS